MITGHLGIAAAVGSRWRKTSVPWLLAASVAPDVWDVTLALAGVCNPSGLYSHTLHAALLLGAVVGGAAFVATGSRATGLASALLVLAHLPPDMITGHKLFWPGGPLIGLALYTHPVLDFVVELPITVGGWWLLRRSGVTPRWVASLPVLLIALMLQAGLDVALAGGAMRATACIR